MDLRKLAHVVTVARAGSFSKAAEELHITQPALSRSIAALEARYGLRIFDRSRHGAALTSMGRVVVEQAENLLKQSAILDHNLGLYGRGELGSVAFGMWSLIGSMILPGLSSYIVRERPRLAVRASVNAADTLLQELFDTDIEMLFCGEGQIEISPELDLETVGAIDLAMLIRRGHPLAGRRRLQRSDLLGFPLLCAVELSQIPGDFVEGGVFICDNYDVLRHTVQDTDGIWFTSLQLARQELDEGSLVLLRVVDYPRFTRVGILQAKLRGFELSPAARAIGGYVRDYLESRDQ